MSRSIDLPASERSETVDRWKALRAWSTFRRGYEAGKDGPQSMRDVLSEVDCTSDKSFIRAWIAFHAVYWTTKDGVEAMWEALSVAAGQAEAERRGADEALLRA